MPGWSKWPEMASRLRKWLALDWRAKGLPLVIAMPNYRSYDAHYYGKYWNAYDVPRHLWHFDPESFGAFAKKRGFVVEQQHAMPLDPFYNAMVSAEYKPGFSFLPWTILVGGWAYLKGLVNTDKASSIIYILKKNN